METIGVEDAFLFLKAAPETRAVVERRLRRKLQAALGQYQDQAVSAIQRGEQVDYAQLFADLRAAVEPEVAALTTAEALRLSVDVGIVFDPAVISQRAIAWAQNYTYDLITGITDTTRKLVQQAESAFFSTPGMTQGDLARLLEPAFGGVRSEMIAITETTRAAAAATNELQGLLNETGVQMIRVWETSNDELVCPICGPLNGQPQSVWTGEFGDGPPAHVRCRCGIGLSALDPEFHLREAVDLGKQRLAMFEEMGDKKLIAAAKEDLRVMRERLN